MKVGLYGITYAGIWYDGPALSFKDFVLRAKKFGFSGIELDGKRPMGNPMDLDGAARREMRAILEGEGMDIPCVAANNDFTNPIPERRENELLMVREIVRLAADLGAKCVRLFAEWPGVVMRDDIATYDMVRGGFYTSKSRFPYATRLERWRFLRDCLAEAAGFGEEFGVVMALQNHAPFIRHWKDSVDLVREVGSPWLKHCFDLPNMSRYDRDWVAAAVAAVGGDQVHSHFGGEYTHDDRGRVVHRPVHFGQPLPDYAHFIRLMGEIGYDGYITFELCHPFLSEDHEPLGVDAVDEQARLALEYMTTLIEENL